MRILGPVAALVCLLLVAVGCGADVPVGTSASADLGSGKAQFVEKCGSCHVLADAGTTGAVGPNLDDAFGPSRVQGLDESTFVQVVREQIAYPGEGSAMPADLVASKDADDVAAYVGRYAGNPEIEPSAPVAPADGEGGGAAALFGQNCASCHTLAAAGATGTIGPSLDELQPAVDLVVATVTNGKGAMPAFGGQLTEEQIAELAQFVADSAGQ